MKAYIKRYLPHPFSLLLPAALAWAASLLADCTDRVDEWIPDGRTASVTPARTNGRYTFHAHHGRGVQGR